MISLFFFPGICYFCAIQVYRYILVPNGAYFATCLEGVDTSSPALEIAKENIALNGLDSRRISFLRQDATEFMKDAISKHEKWDIVILDPPKLAPRKKVCVLIS